MAKKQEVRKIYVDGRYVRTAKVEICRICGGHVPVTKSTADGECLGHVGIKENLL